MKKRLKKILAVGIISLFAISCSDKKEIEPTILESESKKATETTETAANTPSVVAANPVAAANGQQTITPIPAPVATTVNAQPQKVAPGMNPAHGEPGHRCDISVGAPLNSPPGKAPAPAAAAPQPMPQPQTVTPVKPAGPVPNPMNLAVNPAHGEAGHSCAIAVGAPFK